MWCDVTHSMAARLLWLCILLGSCLWNFAQPCAAATKAKDASADSTDVLPSYQLSPVKVSAERITPELKLRELPGQTSWVDLEPFKLEMSNVAQVLDQLPGLHVRSYGSFGHLATASLRGANPSQVTIYLDGIPLTHAGAGVTNLAELPFSGIGHIEVYRGFAPVTLPGASMGGAINLVTSRAESPEAGASKNSVRSQSTLRFGAGNLDTQRFGFSQKLNGSNWDFLLVGDVLQSSGAFDFYDDNGTPWTIVDDNVLTPRRNNWIRSEELLARIGFPFRSARITFVNQWMRRKQGFAGISNNQNDHARSGVAYNLSNLHIRLPSLSGGRLQSSIRFFYDWRRDTFSDPANYQYKDNRDVTQAFGTQVSLNAHVPLLQTVTTLFQLRQETYAPSSEAGPGPQSSRSFVEWNLGNRWATRGNRLALQTTVRVARESDQLFRATVLTSSPVSLTATRSYVEPSLGLRVRLIHGLFAEASYGEYHRTPSFLELFGNNGPVDPNPELIAEQGINRDIGLEWSARIAGLRVHTEAAHFRNHTSHLIVFLPNGQRKFKARNIRSARMEGEEFSWSLRPDAQRPRWHLQGNFTRLRTEDRDLDPFYAGNPLPGRPENKLFARFTLASGPFDASWQYQKLGFNYLDRANLYSIAHSDRHGVDLAVQVRQLRFKVALRNIQDNKSVDVLNTPLPGRTYSFTTEIAF